MTFGTKQIVTLAMAAPFALPDQAVAERSIQCSIQIKGKTILRAATSDNGHPDPDAVWLYLLDLQFQLANEFALKAKHNTIELQNATLDLPFGGLAKINRLKMVKVDDETDTAKWKVDPETVRLYFNLRYVRRADVKRIEQPGRVLKKGALHQD